MTHSYFDHDIFTLIYNEFLESQQYRTGLYMRDPRHQPQRRHLMGYPHAYAAAGMRAYSIQKVGNNISNILKI